VLTPGQLEDVIARLSYWPGWEFSVYQDKHLGPCLFIIARVPDREDPGRVADLGIRARIPPAAMASELDLAEWVLWRLEEAAVHEAREGLRLDGQLVDDPHAAGARP
jgi:hypothetical protein